MARFQYSKHPFDMNEYFSGERVVIGGMVCDWEEKDKKESAKPEEKAPQVANLKIVSEKTKELDR